MITTILRTLIVIGAAIAVLILNKQARLFSNAALPLPPEVAQVIWLAIALAVSRVAFGTVLPGVIAALAGCLALWVLPLKSVADPMMMNLGILMIPAGPVAIALAAYGRAAAHRRGEPWPAHVLPPAFLWVALVILGFAGFGLLGPSNSGPLVADHETLAYAGLLAWWYLAPGLVRPLLPVPGRWPADGWTVVNSCCGYGSFIFSCLTLPLFLPLALILLGNRERWIASVMRRAMRFVFWVTPTITWRCDGDLAALDAARVVVSNHEGMLDILAACALPGTRTLLAKSWVFKAFPLGVAARAAGLRNSDLLLPEDYQEGVAATLPDPGVGIFVFPEGSRSRSGAIGRFRPGAFVLAKSLGCPVVPVAIAGPRLGIRPGSLWIHPSLVVSRVLPPMTLEPDETIRAFAGRVRMAIVDARHRLLTELLTMRRMTRNRWHFFTGLGFATRRAVAEEERTGAWRTVLAAPADDGDWLLIGCGWSTIPVTLRQLLPAARIVAVEPAAARRAVARHAWLDPANDVLSDDPATLVIPAALAGVVCWQPPTEPLAAALLERALAAAPAVVLIAGRTASPSGYVRMPSAVASWSLFRRS